MAEAATLKRQREETHVGVVEEDLVVGEEDPKRQKSYNQILSLLEAEEEIPTQDLSSLMSTLEHEISFDDSCSNFDLVGFTSSETTTTDPENPSTASDLSSSSSSSSSSITDVTSLKEEEEDVDEEDDKESVIRHLLEASDDELGIPQAEVVRYSRNDGEEEDEINGGDLFFSVCDGLWEFEDEAANYYTYLQSQLFM